MKPDIESDSTPSSTAQKGKTNSFSSLSDHRIENGTPEPFRDKDHFPLLCITLVGAGCHDAGWLSIDARKALEEADAIVYDDLVDESILDLAPSARKIYRGKRGRMKSADQKEINLLLAGLVRQYPNVVRLKGGDPMIFGRGMEEIESLENQGIQCRIIPGISSFYGIPAKELAGLTKRKEAGGFMVLTAHTAGKARSSQEWQEIAGFDGTVVFMMGMQEAALISEKLIEAGKDPFTACAILTSPLFTLTKSAKTVLCDLEKAIEKNHLKSPGIIMIGGAAKSCKPLKPLYIGLSGSAPLNERIRKNMPPRFQFAPVLKTRYENYAPDLSFICREKPDWLVFTSAHGAQVFLDLLQMQNIDLRKLSASKIACIGHGTAEVFKKHLLWPDLIPDQPEGSLKLAKELLAITPAHSKIILFQSEQALDILQCELKETMKVRFVPLYSFQTVPARNPMSPIIFDALVLASRNAARAFLEMNPRPSAKVLIALSEEIGAILKNGINKAPEDVKTSILIARHPDAASVQKLLFDLL